MDRFLVEVKAGGGLASALVSPVLMSGLGVAEGEPIRLLFGCKEAGATLRSDAELQVGELYLSVDLIKALCLDAPITLTVLPGSDGQVVLGPLVGLLIAEEKLAAVLKGRRDTVYCRYSRYASEDGILLCFFGASGLSPRQQSMKGYRHHCNPGAPCSWEEVRLPMPRVIYDRCFGVPGREQAAKVRRIAKSHGLTVINSLPKLTKLQTFEALRPYPELAAHLPSTIPLTAGSLADSLERWDDLYLKPDALYKGKGIYRVTRQGESWVLQTRGESANRTETLVGTDALIKALAQLLPSGYLIQEGLDLARYLGNRFDFRSLVQKDGQGRWVVSGLVARVAPEGSVITSPRSGGQIAPADCVLKHAFPDRWEAIVAELTAVSIAISERLDQELGPIAELGLDVGVLTDGAIRLIEANGKPLRVSLERLRDPAVTERINRLPLQYAAWLDLGEVVRCPSSL